MNKTKVILALLSTAIFFSFAMTSFETVVADSAMTALSIDSSESTYLYLPIVTGNYLPQTPSLFGVDVGSIYPTGDLQAMRQAGAFWLRHDVRWEDVQPNGPTEWNWAAIANLENQMLYAQEYDMQLILFVHGTPTWARKAGYEAYSCGAIASEYLADFGNFMYEMVSRYSYPPYNVIYWELYNEPDIAPGGLLPLDSEYGCWGDVNDAYFGGSYYADMLEAVYPRIKDANPLAQVLLGGLLLDCDPDSDTGCKTEDEKLTAQFLEGVLRHHDKNDGGKFFDGVSFHGYDGYRGDLGKFGHDNWDSSWNSTGPVGIAKARFIRDLLNNPAFSATDKYLMNTESAIICGGMDDPPGLYPCEDEFSSDFELTKAYYLTQVYTTALADNLFANIWYMALGWRNSGLLYSDYAPRPAYYAYNTVRERLLNSQFSREINDYSGVSVYEFNRSGKKIWVIWSLDGLNKTISLPSKPSIVVDALGNSVIPDNPIEVTIKPLIIEF